MPAYQAHSACPDKWVCLAGSAVGAQILLEMPMTPHGRVDEKACPPMQITCDRYDTISIVPSITVNILRSMNIALCMKIRI